MIKKIKHALLVSSVMAYGKLSFAASDTWKLAGSGSSGIDDIANQVNSSMKQVTDALLPVASIVAVVIAGGFIMFSSQSGWKRLINAAIGSAIAFGAIMIIGSIYKAMGN